MLHCSYVDSDHLEIMNTLENFLFSFKLSAYLFIEVLVQCRNASFQAGLVPSYILGSILPEIPGLFQGVSMFQSRDAVRA